MKNETFENMVATWLEPLGFELIFKNHPSNKCREIHYIKNGARVICVNPPATEPECHIHRDLFTKDPITCIRSTTFAVPSEKAIEAHTFITTLTPVTNGTK